MMDNVTLRKRMDSLKTERNNVEGIWDVIERFVAPYRGSFFQDLNSESTIDWRRREIFDSTAPIAAKNLSSAMHSNLTNSAYRWFNMDFRDERIKNLQPVKLWLEAVVDIIWQMIQESNFDLAAGIMYMDLVSFGTGMVAEEEKQDDKGDFEEIDFKCLPLRQCFFELDSNDKLLNFYRLFHWTPLQIINKFGEDNVPDRVKQLEDSNQAGAQKLRVVYSVYHKPENKGMNTMSVLSADKRPFGYKYFMYDGDNETLGSGGYYEMPVSIPRYGLTVESVWGHSPAMLCLSDILSLNQLVELILAGAEKAIDPPVLTTRNGVFGDVDLSAAGLTVVQNMDAIKVFESRGRFDVGELRKDDLQNSIDRTFFVDQLQLKDSPAMTATEVQVRYQLMQKLLSPVLGRLQTDWLDFVVERTFKIAMRNGLLPSIPNEVNEGPSELDIEYLGLMAKSQKMDEVLAVERWMANLRVMAETKPEVMDIVNFDETGKDTGYALGVPAKYMNSKAQIKIVRNARQQKQQREQAIAETAMRGEAMKAQGEGMGAMRDARAI
jgi:hypothetical protein